MLLWANASIHLITPFLTWSCRALRCLLTAGNQSVSAERRCGSGVSTPFTPMVSTYRKGMTNFPLFYPFHRHYIYFTSVLRVSLSVGFVLHPLSDSLLFTNLIIFLQSKTPGTYFVRSQVQNPTLLFTSSSVVFISHLTNLLSYSMFMYVAFFSCLTLPLRKNRLGSKCKANNICFAFIPQVL